MKLRDSIEVIPERSDDATDNPIVDVSLGLFDTYSDAFAADVGLDRLIYNHWPAKGKAKHVLTPEGTTLPPDETYQQRLDDCGGETADKSSTRSYTPSNARKQVVGAVRNACEDNLPPAYEFANCTLDFSPIEEMTVPTCRLAARESTDLARLGKPNSHPVVALCADLYTEQVPYIFQMVVSKPSADRFAISVRLAVYEPQYGIATEEDFARHLQGGPAFDLQEYFDDSVGHVTSNFALDDSRYFRISTDEDGTPHVHSRRNASEYHVEAARKLLKGTHQCHDLYVAGHDNDLTFKELYRTKDYFTKIRCAPRNLRHFLGLVTYEYEFSPWDKLAGAGPPDIVRSQTIEDESDILQALGDERPAVSENRAGDEGGDAHVALKYRIERFYKNRGYTVVVTDEEEEGSVPDLSVRKDGIGRFVEVEIWNKSKPANILINAARAAYHGFDVTFVCEAHPQKILDLLRDPVYDRDYSRTRFYNQSETLDRNDESTPVLPKAAGECEWWYVPTGPLKLIVDGDVRATGPIDESVATYDYETAQYTVENGQHIVRDRDGNVVGEYTTKGALEEEWKFIRLPFVPTRITYLQGSTIKYLDGENIEDYQPTDVEASWKLADDSQQITRQYEAAEAKYFEQFTAEMGDDVEIPHEELRAHFDAWYEAQTARKLPNKSYFGIHRPEDIETKENNEEVGKQTFYASRTWQWPRDMVSPDLPFAGDDDDRFEEWDR